MKTRENLIKIMFLSSMLGTNCHAEGFNIQETIKLSYSIPNLGQLIDNASPALEATSASIRFLDGSIHTIRSPDNQATLGQLLVGKQAVLIIDNIPVTLTTSAPTLAQSYQQSGQRFTHIISTTVEGRPWTLEWTGALEDIEASNTYTAIINGNRVVLRLPKGTTLSDFSGGTPLTIIDANGKVLLNHQRLNDLTLYEVYSTANELGVLGLDMSLRGAQNQTMALSFSLISDHVDQFMRPGLDAGDHCLRGFHGWAATQTYDVSGNVGGAKYSGDIQSSMASLGWCAGSGLLGIAVGHGHSDIDTQANSGRSNLGGPVIAPYAAISFMDQHLVLDGILLFQDLEGDATNSSLVTPISFKGDRVGYRLSGTYYLAKGRDILWGITAGCAYSDDDLTGTYFGTRNQYGTELGELFVGAKLGYRVGRTSINGSAIYHRDITSKVDDSAKVFSNGKDGRVELKLSGEWALTPSLKAMLTASATLLDANTRYSGVKAHITYDF
jgi:hypothetical protein